MGKNREQRLFLVVLAIGLFPLVSSAESKLVQGISEPLPDSFYSIPEVIGISPADGKSVAVRNVYWLTKEKKQKDKCTYPKINGKRPAGVRLYLCTEGACQEWIVYDHEGSCTEQEKAKKALDAAKQAFSERGIDLKIKPVALTIKNRAFNESPNSIVEIPQKILKPLGFAQTISLEWERHESPQQDDPQAVDSPTQTLTAKAKGYPNVVLKTNDISAGFPAVSRMYRVFAYSSLPMLFYFNAGSDEVGSWEGPYWVDLKSLAAQMKKK